ncbi:MAG: PGF-pre-PGF domain-containing protein [Methanosarcinaceae archaeon]
MGLNLKIVFLLVCTVFLTIVVSNVPAADAITVEKLTAVTSNTADEWCYPAWSPDGDEILFRRGGELYKVFSDGSGETRLTDTGGNVGFYSWSPDGSKILYSSITANYACDLWVMNSDGSSATRVTSSTGEQGYGDGCGAWSPDGSKIAYVSEGEAFFDDHYGDIHVIVMDSDGSNKQAIGHSIDISYCAIAWSPDSSKIAFTEDETVVVVNSDGSGMTTVAYGYIEPQTSSWQSEVWSPDGSTILCWYPFMDGDSDVILTAKSDGSGRTQLTANGIYSRHPRFSPDGSRIVFSSSEPLQSDNIWVMDENGDNKVQLTTSPARDTCPVWSPDGTKIAFCSDRDGYNNIWVMDLGEIESDGADLTITDIWWDLESPKVGDEIVFSYRVENIGTKDTTSEFNNFLYIDGERYSISSRGSLEALESKDRFFTRTWNAASGEHEIKVVADGYEEIDEYKGNNVLVKTLKVANLEGRVLSGSNNEGIYDVAVTLSPGGFTATTSPNGFYSFANLPAGEYTIEASKDGYIFDSVEVIVNEEVAEVAPIIFGHLDSSKINAEIVQEFYFDEIAGTYVVGDKVPITYTIKNSGEYEHTFYASCSLNPRDGSSKVWNTPCEMVSLKPDEEKKITLIWEVQPAASHVLYNVNIGVWATQQNTYLSDNLDKRIYYDVFKVIDGETSVPGWYLSFENSRKVMVDGATYTAVPAYKQSEGISSWLIFNENDDVEDDPIIYKKAVETAEVSSWITPDTTENLVVVRDAFNEFSDYSFLAKYVLWIRDTASNLLGKYILIASTGGGSLATEMSVTEATKVASKEILDEMADKLIEDLEGLPKAQITEGKVKQIFWTAGVMELSSASSKLDRAIKVIEDHDSNSLWSYEEANSYYSEYSQAAIIGMSNMELIRGLQPGSDLCSQIKDATFNAVEGAAGDMIEFDDLKFYQSFESAVGDMEAVQNAAKKRCQYEEEFKRMNAVFNENAEKLQEDALKNPEIKGIANCPVTLHVYDSNGRHTGYSSEGGEFGIPNSYYLAGYEKSVNNVNVTIPESIVLYDINEDYRFEIHANFSEEDKLSPENQRFNFTLILRTEDKTTNVIYENVSLTENTIAILPANITTTEYTMSIDNDGNGVVEITREPKKVTVTTEEGTVEYPLANFSANITSGYAPLTVQFTDQSTGSPTFWAWDFDSDGTVDSGDQNPVYTYEQSGIYSVSLTVSNEKGSSSEVKSNYIEVYETGDEEEIKNIIETLEADESFTIFVSNLNAANLSATLSSEGPFTVFTPTDDAFEALPEGILDALMNDTEALTEILLYHMADGKMMAADLSSLVSISTLQGEYITINVTDDGRVFVEDAEIILADIEASNGVIHAIDAVMIPPEEYEEIPESPSTELPDLMVQSVSRDISAPKIGDTITFDVHVYNEAPVPAGSSTLGFYVDGVEIESKFIPELEAYSGFIQTFSWVADRAGAVQVSFVSHADFEVAERSELANEMTQSFSIGSIDPESGSGIPENESSSVDSDVSSSANNGGSSSSSSSKSSSSGGGAGSPEPASNVEVKELSQQFVTNGNHVKFGFPRNVTCITYVDFDPKRSLGKVTTIVEMLKGVSKVVSTPPSGMVYRNANIWVGNAGTASPDNIENAVVGFRVEKDWIASNGVDESEIRLCRFSEEKWGELSTRKIREDSNYVYFEAETPGFSPFSITVPSPEGGVSGSAASATEGKDIVRGESGDVSSENDSFVLEASAVEVEDEMEDEEDGARTSGCMTKILLSFGLLSVMILIGFMVAKKQS